MSQLAVLYHANVNLFSKVIDANNSIEISKVIVSNSDNKNVTQTDEKGSFVIFNFGTYTFSKDGYFSKTITFSNTDFRIIELKSKINQDKYTEYVCEQFDIQNKEETSVSIPMNLDGIDDMEWNIGVLYGGSGSGSSGGAG